MMPIWKSNLSAIPVGLYEKALPAALSWYERLLATRRAGYDFLEISIDDSDRRIARLDWKTQERTALRQAVQDTAVPILSMSLSSHRRFALGSASEKTRQTALDIFAKAIDLAVELGLRLILVAGAENYYEERDAGSQERFLESLGHAFEWAAAAGVMLALENWDIQINSISRAMRYVNYFNSPWFQLYADIGNLAHAGLDIVSQLEIGRGHIAAVHVKDTLPGQLRYVPPGEGVVPFEQSFAALASMEFQGPVTLELWTESLPNAIELVTEARSWLQTMMEVGWQAAQMTELLCKS
ncbi:MAG: L-ribulose-5-phosphate 3-epimerase [Candidatus Promineifilaceae bacterium]|nr:L-ribulose-5-phosphate 3-epimerase [Candidatus Promineifilaceae bacterium]